MSRIERKFLITELPAAQIELAVKHHPARFSEIYHKRQVNNIYFDTPEFNHYTDNINGESSRVKVRIRWYGATFGLIANPVIEFKIKKGITGNKQSFLLKGFTLDNCFTKEKFMSLLDHAGIQLSQHQYALNLSPTLLNSYQRKYFLSDDKFFRLTIDTNLVFYRIKSGSNLFLDKFHDRHSTVVELKYLPEKDEQAADVTSQFSFPVTKSSKYIRGFEHIYF